MENRRKVKGLSLMLVNKDYKVTLIDLELVGLKITKEHVRFLNSYAKVFSEIEAYHEDLIKGCISVLKVGRYRGRLLLCKFYIDDKVPGNRVRAIAFLTFSSGLLKDLVKQLECQGWKKVFLFEVSKWRTKSISKW